MSYPVDLVVLLDPSGQQWHVGVNNQGLLTATASTGLAVVGNIIADISGQNWSLSLNADGQLVVTAVASANSIAKKILKSPTGDLWILTTLPGGGIMTSFSGTAPIDPAVGYLDPPNDAYPRFSQPGGPGTTTFPQQPSGGTSSWDGIPNEIGQGLWTAGCGHWFNNWLVQSDSVFSIQSAIICCPICSYIQAVVTPYSLIHTDSYFIIFA